MYCQEEYVEFGLQYVANKDEQTGKFALSPSKVRKFSGFTLLATKGDFQLEEFRRAKQNYLELVLSNDQLQSLTPPEVLATLPLQGPELYEGFGPEL